MTDEKLKQEIEQLKASRLEDIEFCNSTWRSQFEQEKEKVRILSEALKMYASLKGQPLHWPDRDYYSYLQDPAIEALAKVSRMGVKND